MIPLYSRLMTPSEYGVMSIFTSLTDILSIIFGLGIRGAILRYYFEGKNDFISFFRSNLLLIAAFGGMASILLISFSTKISYLIEIPRGILVIALITAIPNSIFESGLSYFVAKRNSETVSFLNVLKVSIFSGLGLLLIFYLNNEKYYAHAFGLLAASFVVLFYLLHKVDFSLKFKFEKSHYRYSLLFGIPVVVHLLSQNILNTFDQLIINQLIGSYHAGLYAIGYKVGFILSIVSMATLKAWSPVFIEKMNREQYDEINLLARKYSMIIMLVAIVLVTFSSEILLLIAGPSFKGSDSLIPIIIISYYFLFLYTLYVNYSFYFKKTILISLITVSVGILNIILNYVLIPVFGFEAAAWTTLFCYFMLFILHFISVKTIFSSKCQSISLRYLMLPTLFLIISAIALYLFKLINLNWHLFLIIKLIFSFFIILFFRKRIKI